MEPTHGLRMGGGALAPPLPTAAALGGGGWQLGIVEICKYPPAAAYLGCGQQRRGTVCVYRDSLVPFAVGAGKSMFSVM